MRLLLAVRLAEATLLSERHRRGYLLKPKAARQRQSTKAPNAPVPPEAAMMLVCATRSMLRRTTPGNEKCYTAL
jgi:hypothetical protein